MNRVLVASCFAAVAAATFFTVPRARADDAAKPPAAAPVAPAAPAPSAKEEKVRKLLRLTGAEAASQQMIDMMLKQFAGMPGLPAGFVEKFKAKCDIKQIVDLSVPSYLKHLDEPTIDAAIAFHESPAGRKLVAEQPAILAECGAAGQEWGRKIALEVIQELEQERAKK
jgi:hypothetical protein